jgi:hypothetical protein
MTQETKLAIRDNREVFALPDVEQFKKDMEAINKFQKIVQELMVLEQDYGIIPGTKYPTLLKPGAEKITKIMGLADCYEIADKQEDWSKPFFHYQVKCSLISIKGGVVISEGFGECNSMESKYRYRDSKRKCPQCGAEAIIKGKEEYGGGYLCFKKQGGCGATFKEDDPTIIDQVQGKVENDDIYSLVNTILKMAEKRALVDAALHAGRLSNIFTQDIEDMPSLNKTEGVKPTIKQEPQKQQTTGQTDKQATEKQVALLKQKSEKMGYTTEKFNALLFAKFGISCQKIEDVKMSQVNTLIAAIESGEGL